MKTPFAHIWFLLSLSLAVAGCGKGGTETGTTEPIDPQILSSRIETVGSALVLSVEAGGDSDASASKDIAYRSSADWDVYLESGNITALTDIFGPSTTVSPPESRVRVVLHEYQVLIDSVFSTDPSLECQGSERLDEGDTIPIPFFGEIPNGSAGNRYFQCVREWWPGQKMLYGQDSTGVLRIAYMKESTEAVSAGTDPDWGDTFRSRSVIQSSYAESTVAGVTHASLDLQYAKALLYNGTDRTFDTVDDYLNRNRSRITGSAELNASGVATAGGGDFTVIKCSQHLDAGDQLRTSLTNAIGRGNAVAGGHMLFNIDVDATALEGLAGIYCLASGSDATPPAYADPANCSSLEDAVPWSDDAFPFPISPEIDEPFEAQAFYQANDTDLISATGSNFTIPEYQTSPL